MCSFLRGCVFSSMILSLVLLVIVSMVPLVMVSVVWLVMVSMVLRPGVPG